jgi:hypothetical protein
LADLDCRSLAALLDEAPARGTREADVELDVRGASTFSSFDESASASPSACSAESSMTRRRLVATTDPVCGTGLGAFEPPANLRRLRRSSVPCAFALSPDRFMYAFESASATERVDAADAGARASADDDADGAETMRADELTDRGALAAEKPPEYVDAKADDEFILAGGSS